MTDASPAASTSGTAGTRRERQRQATMTEIVTAARSMVGSPGGLSLRSVAQQVGMTAPALYRYVESGEDLTLHVAAEVYDDLVETLTAARDRQEDEPSARLVAASTAFRQWALAHREEFALTFANPITLSNVHEGGEGVCAAAGARFGTFFGELFVQWWRISGFPVPSDEELGAIVGDLGEHKSSASSDLEDTLAGPDVPAGLSWVFLRMWSKLYGTVTLEAFGHVNAAVVDSAALFRDMLAEVGREIAMDDATDRLQAVIRSELAR